MEEEKVDRRTRKTKKILLDSLTELMAKKKISSITVKELTDLADVNRSTFYLYYKDIFDMVEQVENEMLKDFEVAFDKYILDLTHNNTTKISIKGKTLWTSGKDNYRNMVNFYTYLFQYVKNNAKMCKTLLGPDGDNAFIEKFKNAILMTKPPFDESVPQIKIHYLRPFTIAGCVGVIQQWLEDDLAASPEEMGVIISDMVPMGQVNGEKE